MASQTYSEYWTQVLGQRTAGQVVMEFELTDSSSQGVSEWLGGAEEEARRAGEIAAEVLEGWAAYHGRAVRAIQVAIEEYLGALAEADRAAEATDGQHDDDFDSELNRQAREQVR